MLCTIYRKFLVREWISGLNICIWTTPFPTKFRHHLYGLCPIVLSYKFYISYLFQTQVQHKIRYDCNIHRNAEIENVFASNINISLLLGVYQNLIGFLTFNWCARPNAVRYNTIVIIMMPRHSTRSSVLAYKWFKWRLWDQLGFLVYENVMELFSYK